jgi:hypothetical protein
VAVWRDRKVEWMDVEQLEDSEDGIAYAVSSRGQTLKEDLRDSKKVIVFILGVDCWHGLGRCVV